jgi:ATP/maltotriose-dependent transcriptional regulator MalT
MRRSIVIPGLAVGLWLLATAVFGQSLLDNPDYKKAKELQAMAQQAYEQGDYDEAAEYAQQAEAYIKKSDAYINNMILLYRANSLLKAAGERVAYLTRVGVDPKDAQVLSQAQADLAEAKKAFEAKAYDQSITYSRRVLDALIKVSPPRAK